MYILRSDLKSLLYYTVYATLLVLVMCKNLYSVLYSNIHYFIIKMINTIIFMAHFDPV